MENEAIFVELEMRIQALYRPYLPRGVPERTLLLLASVIQASTSAVFALAISNMLFQVEMAVEDRHESGP